VTNMNIVKVKTYCFLIDLYEILVESTKIDKQTVSSCCLKISNKVTFRHNSQHRYPLCSSSVLDQIIVTSRRRNC